MRYFRNMNLNWLLAIAVFVFSLVPINVAKARHANANPLIVNAARNAGFDPHEDCTFTSTGYECSRSTRSTALAAGAIAGIAVGAVALVGLFVWWVWPSDDDASFVEFKELEGDNYLPMRSWVGVKHNLTEAVQFSLGGFWLKGEDAAQQLIPNKDNIGVEFNMAYKTNGLGTLSLNSTLYSQGNTRLYSIENHGVKTDYHRANFTDRGLDTRIGLRWKMTW